MQFPEGTPAYEWHDHTYGLASQGIPWSRPVQPVQLYAAAVGLVLFGMVVLARRLRTFGGQIFLFGVISYSAATYTLEIFRGDPKRGWLWMWSVSQMVAVAVLAAALVAYGLLWRRFRRDPSRAFYLGAGIDAAVEADRKSREE